jgi:cytochrome P450
MKALQREIDDAFTSGALSHPVRFKDAVQLPYLTAVIKESMRMHHSLGTGLPRVVPAQGASIAGRWVPGGTTVIMNANAVNFDRSIFGQDADQFRPERWLDPEHAAVMSRHDMSFGYGPRICAGRYITMTEMYKLLPVMVREYDFEFAKPDSEWQVWHGWFQHQRGIDVMVKRRQTIGQ